MIINAPIHTFTGVFGLEALDEYGCLHFETRIICGVSEPAYSPEELSRLNAENNRLIEIDGVSKKGYEWKQTMRRLERAGKEAKLKRETFKVAGNNTEVRNQNMRLKAIEEKYQLIADKTGIKAQYERMAIVKGKSVDKSVKSGYNRFRKVQNIGNFKDLEEPMQKRHITKLIKEMDIDYSDIEIDIIRKEELIGTGLMGYAFPNGKKVQLYPDAFKDREQLVKTLGHERVHCEQVKLFGEARTMEEELYYEKGPIFSEKYWWDEYVRRTGYGKRS